VARRPTQTVEEFLTHHPDVQQYLMDTDVSLALAFGDTIKQVSLEVRAIPELMDGDVLLCTITTSLPPAEALARLNAFDEAWGLDHDHQAQGRVLFLLAFLPEGT
jgi:hypothetical protein